MSTPAPVRVGPLAELAINRVMMRSLREQLADARAIADRRASDAYAEGLHRGRGGRLIALLGGGALGSVLTAIAFSWFS